MSDAIELAARLTNAIETADLQAYGACYATDAVIWHNTDRVLQSREENVAALRGFHAVVSNFRVEVIARAATTDGFVQQHLITATTGAGTDLTLACCIVVRTTDGKIVRLDEYLDSADLRPLTN